MQQAMANLHYSFAEATATYDRALQMGWDPATLANDIAIVKLVTNVTMSAGISPVCLPDDYTDTSLPSLLQNLDPVVVGWGATRTFGPAQTVLHQVT